MPTKEQQRSAFALEHINDFGAQGVSKEYANFIVGVPTMILTNGIAQTMAFLLAKGQDRTEDRVKNGEKPATKVFAILKKWLSKKMPVLSAEGDKQFLEWLAKLPQSVPRRLRRRNIKK